MITREFRKELSFYLYTHFPLDKSVEILYYSRMKSGIYRITNTVNNKFYIGSSKDIDKRWYDHKRELYLNIHINPKLQHSWNYHGQDKFLFEMVEEVSEDKLIEREQFYLDTLKPYERDVGYNINPSAFGGDNITHHPNRDAFIEKMKVVMLGENNGMFGKEHTDAAIQKQKDKAIGRYTLEWFTNRYGIREGKKKYNERREMLANRPKEVFSHPNPMKGKSVGPMPDEVRKKSSETKMKMKTQKYFLIADIRTNKYSNQQLCDKYGIGITAVKYYKSKVRMEGVI